MLASHMITQSPDGERHVWVQQDARRKRAQGPTCARAGPESSRREEERSGPRNAKIAMHDSRVSDDHVLEHGPKGGTPRPPRRGGKQASVPSARLLRRGCAVDPGRLRRPRRRRRPTPVRRGGGGRRPERTAGGLPGRIDPTEAPRPQRRRRAGQEKRGDGDSEDETLRRIPHRWSREIIGVPGFEPGTSPTRTARVPGCATPRTRHRVPARGLQGRNRRIRQ